MQKIPYMVVLGEKERESNKLAVRKRRSKETVTLSIDEFIDKINLEVGEKHLGEAIQPI
jgi:threonyl-tRNA synthetase